MFIYENTFKRDTITEEYNILVLWGFSVSFSLQFGIFSFFRNSIRKIFKYLPLLQFLLGERCR